MGTKLSIAGGGADGLREKFLEGALAPRFIRTLVSKKRRRFIMGNFDLDMSYITDRLVAMSFPSQNIRTVYRNPLWQVKQVLDTKHGSHYKVYNLCAEETYDPEYFDGRVEVIPFDDNHVPPLSLIKIFCESVHAWLSSDAQNVAVVHCMKPGQLYQTAVELARNYCRVLQKGSQRKISPCYDFSFLHNDGNEKKGDSEQPDFVVHMSTESSIINKKTCLDYNFDKPLSVTGDVRVILYDKSGSRLFYCCFNTAFIVNSKLQFPRGELDKVGRKAKSIFGPTICVELLFGPSEPHHPDVVININNIDDSF